MLGRPARGEINRAIRAWRSGWRGSAGPAVVRIRSRRRPEQQTEHGSRSSQHFAEIADESRQSKRLGSNPRAYSGSTYPAQNRLTFSW